MEKLTSVEAYRTLMTQGKVLFFFTADWCPDCRFIQPVMPEITASHTDIRFIEVDRDEFIDLCEELSIFGIPSFVAYNDGKEIGRFVNKDRKTKEEIEAFIATL